MIWLSLLLDVAVNAIVAFFFIKMNKNKIIILMKYNWIKINKQQIYIKKKPDSNAIEVNFLKFYMIEWWWTT